VQQPQHGARRHLVSRSEFAGQFRRGLRRPAQQGHWVTPSVGVHEFVERFEQTGLFVDELSISAAGGSKTRRWLDPRSYFVDGLGHGVATHARRARERTRPPASEYIGRRTRDDATL
jgi:hypothetical protein